MSLLISFIYETNILETFEVAALRIMLFELRDRAIWQSPITDRGFIQNIERYSLYMAV